MNNKEMLDPEEFTSSLPPEHEDAQAMLDETRQAAREAEESGETARIQAGIEARKAAETQELLNKAIVNLHYLREAEASLVRKREYDPTKDPNEDDEHRVGRGGEGGDAEDKRQADLGGNPKEIEGQLTEIRGKIASVEQRIAELRG